MNDERRKAFEEWYNSTHREPIHPADRRTDGDYRLGISGLWKSYQAAIAYMESRLDSDEVKIAIYNAIRDKGYQGGESGALTEAALQALKGSIWHT